VERIVEERSGGGQIFSWCDLYLRQRCYISNNFLQHLAIAEAVLPFYNWQLLRYKMQHESKVFGPEVYARIFQRHFPALAAIPHASEIQERKAGVPWVTRRWSRGLLWRLCRGTF
jgi:hypothetical protein